MVDNLINMKTKKALIKKSSTNNYPLGDFLIRIKNAAMATRHTLSVPKSKLIYSVAKVLEKEKVIEDLKEDDGKLMMRLVFRSKEPVITHIRLVSKPGLRIYMSVDELEKIKGPSMYLLSTPKGIMSAREAIKKSLGGEVIAEIL